MNPVAILSALLLSFAALSVTKKNILFPIIGAAILIPMDQRFEIAGLDFTVLRILVLAYVIRIFLRNEQRVLRFNNFDKLYIAWQIAESGIYIIQHGSVSAVIYRCGVLFDMLGLYWILRQQITGWHSVQTALRVVAYCAILSAPLMLWEYFSRAGLYDMLFDAGGRFHRGRYRCSGPFPHAIMMGLFWATVVPFFLMLYADRREKLYLFAMISALICILTSASSTPLLTLVAVFFFGYFYKYRHYSGQFAWGLLIVAVCIHFAREKPIWHLLARANVFSGSTGYHRYFLLDEFFNRVSEWALLGVQGTAHWGRGLFDVTNQFVLTGVRGGMVSLLLFIALSAYTIRVPAVWSMASRNKDYHRFLWACTVTGIAHVVSFFAVSYFGQTIVQLILFYVFVATVVENNGFSTKAAKGSSKGLLV